MSNIIESTLDVLATSPTEINHISEMLIQPSVKLVNWVALRDGRAIGEVADDLKELLHFDTVQNLGFIAAQLSKARRYNLTFSCKVRGIVDSHQFEVSETFPQTTFLLEYSDRQFSYSDKKVVRAGEVVQQVFDGDQPCQGLEWALLDIFAPFRAEYFSERYEFGSLWTSWLDATLAAARALKSGSRRHPATKYPGRRPVDETART